jgi:hypothetical protein
VKALERANEHNTSNAVKAPLFGQLQLLTKVSLSLSLSLSLSVCLSLSTMSPKLPPRVSSYESFKRVD